MKYRIVSHWPDRKPIIAENHLIILTAYYWGFSKFVVEYFQWSQFEGDKFVSSYFNMSADKLVLIIQSSNTETPN